MALSDGRTLDCFMQSLPLRERALDRLGDVLLVLDEILVAAEREFVWTAEREDLTTTVRGVFDSLNDLMIRLGN